MQAIHSGEDDWQGEGNVLLIDDDDAVRGVIAKMLQHMGFQVTSKASGAEGLACYRASDPPYLFVTLDWVMPGMDGGAVLRALREISPRLPVVLVSGYSTASLAPDDAYTTAVQKPMTISDLMRAVRSVLGGAGPPGAETSGARG